jgi:transglutaminase-like putative cysteine protease
VTSTPSPTFTPTSTSTNTPTSEAASFDYQPAFGIDYAHPEQYLGQGEQSRISDPTVLDGLRAEEQSLAHLGDIYRWLKSEFTAYAARGRTIGVVTVDQLLKDRQLGGCHDHGLVYAAVARELGYPALMVRTVSIAWVEQFQAGEQGPHVGHVFVEVYLNGRWVLIDSTNGWYVEEGYDPGDPVIPLRGQIAGSSDEIYGFHVERKGIDTWGFGIHSPAESTQAMDELARQLNLESVEYPEYRFQRFAK